MKLMILVLCATLLWAPSLALCQSSQTPGSECALVERAFSAYQNIKVGMKRSDVEKDFIYDGGIQFRNHGRFAYRSCQYIKVDVDFEIKGDSRNIAGSPEDTVEAIPRLYIEPPIKD